MVSYSRLRPAMSRADPRRCCLRAEAAGVGAGAAPRGGSVPVVLMWSPFGRQARVATDKEVLLEAGVSNTEFPRCLPRFSGRPGLAVEPVHGGRQAVGDDRLD